MLPDVFPIGDYGAGFLSPEYDPNFTKSPEGETQETQSFFQFGNTGTGGFSFFQ